MYSKGALSITTILPGGCWNSGVGGCCQLGELKEALPAFPHSRTEANKVTLAFFSSLLLGASFISVETRLIWRAAGRSTVVCAIRVYPAPIRLSLGRVGASQIMRDGTAVIPHCCSTTALTVQLS